MTETKSVLLRLLQARISIRAATFAYSIILATMVILGKSHRKVLEIL